MCKLTLSVTSFATTQIQNAPFHCIIQPIQIQDIEIFRAIFSLVSFVLCLNQFIYIDFFLNISTNANATLFYILDTILSICSHC